jgi:hypothetical protein
LALQGFERHHRPILYVFRQFRRESRP